MNIREAISADAEEIADIHISAWQFAYRGIMDDSLLNSMDRTKKVVAWADAIDNLGWSIYVSQDNGKITGFVHVSEYRDDDMNEGNIGEVASLYIRPELVGTGLGRALFAEGLNRLEMQGFTRIALWVLEQNERSISFYEKFGFRKDGASKTHPKTGLAEVRYVR
jgi:L-amino acid N-acyltransferase YncA